jgi:protein transport protein SEC61 subunit alpha
MASYRTESVYEVLKRYVPTAAMLGGITIGLLTIAGDLLDVIGSSTGILLSVNIIYNYY